MLVDAYGENNTHKPLFIFAAVAIVASLASLTLKETSNQELDESSHLGAQEHRTRDRRDTDSDGLLYIGSKQDVAEETTSLIGCTARNRRDAV